MHELGDERLEVEDGLRTEVHLVLVEGRLLHDRRLESAVDAFEQFFDEDLPGNARKQKKNQ